MIRQKVAIRTKRRSIERTIYRDAQGIRQPRPQQLSQEDQDLKNKLASASVSWDAPLSAAEYAEWRYRSGSSRDLVTRPGPHLLTLTTTPLSAGEVLSESLTVRDTDFHPIGRKVDLRNMGTIEVAELNYDVLPWGDAGSQFDRPTLPNSALKIPASPSVNSVETELAVRYALHKVRADLGEPIDVEQVSGSASVSVVGIVDSAERKKELLAVLNGIQHVTSELQTEGEAGARELNAPITREVPDIVNVRSPIEQELQDHFGDPTAVEKFSKHAIALSGDVMAHAWALRHLSDRFGDPGARNEVALSPGARQLLETMRHDHRLAISDTTNELTQLLSPVLRSMVPADPEPTTRLSLFASAQEVQRLILNLVSGAGSVNTNEVSEPANTARDLLITLRGLDITLEERP